jgi:hypothetical protein
MVASPEPVEVDPRVPAARLLRDLRANPHGSTEREADAGCCTSAPPAAALAMLAVFPLLVWGADEISRALLSQAQRGCTRIDRSAQ